MQEFAKSDGASITPFELLLEAKKVGRARLKQKISRSPAVGQKRTIVRGRGMEFFESRPYVIGDEMRTIDWRVSARLNKIHTKVFIEERGRPVFFLVDHRSTMFFGSHTCFKSVLASRIAARLAQAAINSNDVVSGLIIKDKQEILCPQGGAQSLSRLMGLMALSSQNNMPSSYHQRDWQLTLRHVCHVVHHGSLVFILSDFFGVDAHVLPLLAKLKKKADIKAVFIKDPLEDYLPDLGMLAMTNGVASTFFNSNDEKLRARYKAHRLKQTQAVEHVLRSLFIPFLSCFTNDDVAVILRPFLDHGRVKHAT